MEVALHTHISIFDLEGTQRDATTGWLRKKSQDPFSVTFQEYRQSAASVDDPTAHYGDHEVRAGFLERSALHVSARPFVAIGDTFSQKKHYQDGVEAGS
jgi:hypothetical protein